MAVTILLIYMAGSYLSLMRCYASAWDSHIPADKQSVILSITLSWLALIFWIVTYFDDSEDYFFKIKNYKR